MNNIKEIDHKIHFSINGDRCETRIYETRSEDKRYIWEYKYVNLHEVSKKLLDIDYIIIEPPPERPDFIKVDEMRIS